MGTLETLSWRVTRRTMLSLIAGAGASMTLLACQIVREEEDDDTPDDVDEDEDEDAEDDEDDEDDEDEPDEDQEDEDEPDVDEPEEDESDDEDGDLDDVDDEDDEDEPDDDDDDVDDEDAEEGEDEEDEDEEEPEQEDEDVEAQVVVGDVVDYTLGPAGRWDGPFGSVTLRLHRGWVNGQDVTFIRTDASDQSFAAQEGLVYAPLLANALDEPGSYSDLYLFDGAAEGQLPVMSASPADGDTFSPAFRIHYVNVIGKIGTSITDVAEIHSAAELSFVDIESTDIIVNYPVVTWPGGQIAVDQTKTEALGGGQLIDAPDVDGGQVTFKLHQCYPGSRYIITDTSALPMAPMMGAGEAGGTQLLIAAGAVAPITVFMNGLAGTGAMGFQPGVFNTTAGDPAWSPFWEHFTAEWVNEDDAVAVTSQQQLDDLVASGDLNLYGGVPDTDPDTFVVNCSVPILAPVTWRPPED
jgi:hypothetical protein